MAAVWLALLLAAQAAATGAAAPANAAAPGNAPRAEPKVTVAAVASKAEVGLGEVFAVEVKASGPAGTSYTFPGELADDTVELRTPPVAPTGPAPARRHPPLRGGRVLAQPGADPADPRALPAGRRHERRGRDGAARPEGRLRAAEGSAAAEAGRHPGASAGLDRPRLLGRARRGGRLPGGPRRLAAAPAPAAVARRRAGGPGGAGRRRGAARARCARRLGPARRRRVPRVLHPAGGSWPSATSSAGSGRRCSR